VTSDAGIVPKLAPESSSAVVTSATALHVAWGPMFFEQWQRHLSCALVFEHIMTFGTRYSFALRVDLMSEPEIVSVAHRGRRLLVSRGRVALAAARSSDSFVRLHMIRSLVANVAFAVRWKRRPGPRERVAARAIGSLLAANISRMSLMRKLDTERLPLRKSHYGGLHGRYAFVTIGADSKLRRSEFLDVTRYASSVAGQHRLDGIRLSHVTLIALRLIVFRVIEFGLAL